MLRFSTSVSFQGKLNVYIVGAFRRSKFKISKEKKDIKKTIVFDKLDFGFSVNYIRQTFVDKSYFNVH